MRHAFRFATSTAALAVYDPTALEHRVDDSADWWADWDLELDEVNAGNVVVVGLPSDGRYETVIEDGPPCEGTIVANVRCPSGRLAVVPGEEILGGGLPFARRLITGVVLELTPGVYIVGVKSTGSGTLRVTLTPGVGDGRNHFDEQLLLDGA